MSIPQIDEEKPCEQCPWLSKDERDRNALTPEVRDAAKRGAWFCCHVRMGTCYGAVKFGAALQLALSGVSQK